MGLYHGGYRGFWLWDCSNNKTQLSRTFSRWIAGGASPFGTLLTARAMDSRGRIQVAAAGLHYSHSNPGSEPSLQLTPQFTAMTDS